VSLHLSLRRWCGLVQQRRQRCRVWQRPTVTWSVTMPNSSSRPSRRVATYPWANPTQGRLRHAGRASPRPGWWAI